MYSEDERQAIQETVCNDIAKAKSLRAICEDHKGPRFPDLRTIMRWLADDPDFCQQYTRAREEQADFLAEQIVEIADAPVVEFSADNDEDGKIASAATRAEMERRKQQIEARKWVAAKLKPKAYGDKLTLDGEMNLKLPDDQLESRLAVLLGKAGVAVPVRGEGAEEGKA